MYLEEEEEEEEEDSSSSVSRLSGEKTGHWNLPLPEEIWVKESEERE